MVDGKSKMVDGRAKMVDGRIEKRPIPWREIRERLEGGE